MNACTDDEATRFSAATLASTSITLIIFAPILFFFAGERTSITMLAIGISGLALAFSSKIPHATARNVMRTLAGVGLAAAGLYMLAVCMPPALHDMVSRLQTLPSH